MAIERVNIIQSSIGRQFQNEIYLENPEGSAPQQDVAALIATQWIPHIRGSQWSNLTYQQIIVTRVSGDPPIQHISNILIVGNGSQTKGHACLCPVLKFTTGLAGRANRGRYYIADMAQGFISTANDLLNTAGQTFLANSAAVLMQQWCGPNPATGLRLVIRHRGPEPSETPVTTIAPRATLGIQRRRNVGVGI